MKPVNIIAFKYNEEATLNRHWSVMIDKKELTTWLEEASGPWRQKAKALLNLSELEQTLTTSGTYELLICANCAASGYRSCGDLNLKPFRVDLEDDFVYWHGLAPGTKKMVEFRFHKPQYDKEIRKVIPEVYQ